MNKRNVIVSILIFMWIFTGCGGSSSSSTTTSTTTTGTGSYVDSVVEGVTYVCGTKSGTTDESGTFSYDVNSSCTFTLNSMTLRVVASSDLNGTTTTVFEDNTTIAQFLLSLDVDGNSSNGINITKEVLAVLVENNITTIPTSFSEVETIVNILLADSSIEYSGKAVTDTEVEEHLEETRETLSSSDETAPVITITGDNPLSISQNSTYTEQGATATDAVDGTITVSTSGSVDTSTVGSYSITYTATDAANNTVTATRTVSVTDVTAPVITITGDNPLSVSQNSTYTEQGATATDAVDGSITVITSGSVDTSTVGTYTITYTATDTANNTATATRTVNVTDETAPVITITGDNPLSISQNSTYTEQGATATDAVDGTITVSTSGSVDTSTVGSYTITYTATDTANNTATATRTVSVTSSGPIDITDTILTNGSGNCADFVAAYSSSVTDVNNDTDFEGSLEIEVADSKCTFTANSIPNHDFNDGNSTFTNAAAEVSKSYSITTSPTAAVSATSLSLGGNQGILLNGVPVSLVPAGCYGIDDGVKNCFDMSQPWRANPGSGYGSFKIDTHNAHTQATGLYHYHATPVALFDTSGSVVSPAIGFAADGFPIYGSYYKNSSDAIVKIESSYQLKSGVRESQTYEGVEYLPSTSSEATFHVNSDNYDGQYEDDYEYNATKSLLDECNGMTLNGEYAYYVTDDFPYIIGCFTGTADDSFDN